jgi:hypothetical protein
MWWRYKGEVFREVPRVDPEAPMPPTRDTLRSIPIAPVQGALDEAVEKPGRDEQQGGSQKNRHEPEHGSDRFRRHSGGTPEASTNRTACKSRTTK